MERVAQMSFFTVNLFHRKATEMNPTITARHALDAYDAQRRGRRTHAVMDRISDGMLAAGGILLLNALVPLGFDLPGGTVGISAGGLLIAAAVAWMKRPTRRLPAAPVHETAQLATVTNLTAYRSRKVA